MPAGSKFTRATMSYAFGSTCASPSQCIIVISTVAMVIV
jgi:hypothetical protein